jgi:hypothetical protein
MNHLLLDLYQEIQKILKDKKMDWIRVTLENNKTENDFNQVSLKIENKETGRIRLLGKEHAAGYYDTITNISSFSWFKNFREQYEEFL